VKLRRVSTEPRQYKTHTAVCAILLLITILAIVGNKSDRHLYTRRDIHCYNQCVLFCVLCTEMGCVFSCDSISPTRPFCTVITY